MPEPSAAAAVTAVLVPLLGLLMYVIRAEIRRNTKTTDDTHAQMIPNHGSSLRDAVDRIERRQHEDRETYRELIADVHTDVRATRADLAQHIQWHVNKED